MNIETYAGILKFAIMTQIDYQKEQIQLPFADENYHSGIIRGLQIALEKIDASMFLAEK